MRYERVFAAPRGGSHRALRLWSSLEEYELDEYVSALADELGEVDLHLRRMPTGELVAALRAAGASAAPDVCFGTAATALCEAATLAIFAPVAVETAALRGDERWVSASGFRSAFVVNEAALRSRGLVAPVSWAMLASPRYRGLVVFPDPAVSGAGALALAAMTQPVAELAARALLEGVRRNVLETRSSSWACAIAALDERTPIAVSVEIAARRAAHAHPGLRATIPRDGAAIELEAFAALRGAREPALAQRVLSWIGGPKAREISRRWGKVTFGEDDERRALLDHDRAARTRTYLLAQWRAPSSHAASPRPWCVDDTYRHGLDRDAAALMETATGSLSATSAATAEYERLTAECFGVAHAVAVSSGAAAVLAALAALQLPVGARVAVSPLAPLCTVYPMLALGLVPVFCDTNASDFGLCAAALAPLFREGLAAVLEVPMWGYPVPADRTQAACLAHGVPYALDLAHGHRVLLHGKDLSSYGEVATFSTHEGKVISTGEGGMVLTSDGVLAERVRQYRCYGNLDGKSFGIKIALAGLPAALGAIRMRQFDADLAERKRKAALFLSHLASDSIRPWPICAGGAPNYYTILLEVTHPKPRQVIELLGDHGVPSDQLKYPCQPLYHFAALAGYARPCPNAEALIARLSTVPCHPDLSDEEVISLARLINEVTNNGPHDRGPTAVGGGPGARELS